MKAKEFLVSVRTEHDVPTSFLSEHIEDSMKALQFAGEVKVDVVHPFDNLDNVMFDDVQEEEYTGPAQDSAMPADPFPLVTRVIDKIRGRK